MTRITRRSFIQALAAANVALALLVALAGCNGQGAESGNTNAASSSPSEQAQLVVGALATEDILPLWVALDRGFTTARNVDVELVEFQSATELIAGVMSGNVDMAMTDIMVAASIFTGGTEVQMEWVTLGADASQGRFGIMVGPESDITSAEQLAGVPIAVGSNTILEYVVDGLMEEAGVASDQVVIEEIQKLPVRYQAMASGEVAAAGLPASLLALGEANGCRTIAQDTERRNLSTSVMIARTTTTADAAKAEALAGLRAAWNEAVAAINANPQEFQALLVARANLSEEVAASYPVPTYPSCELPSSAMVEPVLTWMSAKGYLSAPLAYEQATGTFSFK